MLQRKRQTHEFFNQFNVTIIPDFTVTFAITMRGGRERRRRRRTERWNGFYVFHLTKWFCILHMTVAIDKTILVFVCLEDGTILQHCVCVNNNKMPKNKDEKVLTIVRNEWISIRRYARRDGDEEEEKLTAHKRREYTKSTSDQN